MFCSIQCVARQEGRRLLLRRLCQTRNDLTIASQVVAPNNKPLPLINVDYDLQPFEVLIGQGQNLQKRARKDTSDEFELQWANIVCTLIWIADWCCFDKHRISGRNGGCGRVAASMSMHCVDQHELDSCWIILDTLSLSLHRYQALWLQPFVFVQTAHSDTPYEGWKLSLFGRQLLNWSLFVKTLPCRHRWRKMLRLRNQQAAGALCATCSNCIIDVGQ